MQFKIHPSDRDFEIEDLNKREVIVEFNQQQHIINFKDIFESKKSTFPFALNFRFHFFQTKKNFVKGTKDPYLKILDTGIPIPNGNNKTLKFYVRKQVHRENSSYDFWPKNIRKIAASRRNYSFSRSGSVSPSNLELVIRIDSVAYQVDYQEGGFNSRYMIPVSSSLQTRDRQRLYSVSIIKQKNYAKEVLGVKNFVSNIKSFVDENPAMIPYAKSLALPEIIKTRKIDRGKKYSVHIIMKNGDEGCLEKIQFSGNILYQAEQIRKLYEGLLFMFAAGYVHGDISLRNIVKSQNRLLWIDFGLTQQIKSGSFSNSGTQNFMCPDKIYRQHCELESMSYDAVENDLYALCICLLYPYIVPKTWIPNAHWALLSELKSTYWSKKKQEAVIKTIQESYPENSTVPSILCRMFDFCVSVWIDSKERRHSIPQALCTLASLMEIEDENLIRKALSQLNYPSAQISEAFQEYQQGLTHHPQQDLSH